MTDEKRRNFNDLRDQIESKLAKDKLGVCKDDSELQKPELKAKPVNLVKRSPSVIIPPTSPEVWPPTLPAKPVSGLQARPTRLNLSDSSKRAFTESTSTKPTTPTKPATPTKPITSWKVSTSQSKVGDKDSQRKLDQELSPLRFPIPETPSENHKPPTPMKPITPVKPQTPTKPITAMKPLTPPKPQLPRTPTSPIVPSASGQPPRSPLSTLAKPITPPKPNKIDSLKASLALDLNQPSKPRVVKPPPLPQTPPRSIPNRMWRPSGAAMPRSPAFQPNFSTKSTVDLYEEVENTCYESFDQRPINQVGKMRPWKSMSRFSERSDEATYEYIEEPEYEEPQAQAGRFVEDPLERIKSHCLKIVLELVQAEENYVNQLEKGIHIYMRPMWELANSPVLATQADVIFRNIQDIFDFHQRTLLPLIQRSKDDLVALSRTFIDELRSGSFQIYLTFCQGKQKADQLCAQHMSFFDDLSRDAGDLMGVEDFLLLPTQILPRYRLIFSSLIKAYGTEFSYSDDIKVILKTLEAAKDGVEDLLHEVNHALEMEPLERDYSPLNPDIHLSPNIENDIQAGICRYISVTEERADISGLKDSDKGQLINIVRELIQVEQKYVESLEQGIVIYLLALNSDVLTYLPLRGKKFHVFANVRLIFSFHKNRLLPELLACNEDILQIAKLFNQYINEGRFYHYVLYSFNKPRTQRLALAHQQFFEKIQRMHHDRQGLNSFLMQPIQILPRYKLLFKQLIKTLSKDIQTINSVKHVITACCTVEKQLQRLLDTVNEALRLAEVDGIYDVDILCQGMFIRMDEFEVVDGSTRRHFYSKTFLFEKCLVFVETPQPMPGVKLKEKLTYRFSVLRSELMSIESDNQTSLTLCLASKQVWISGTLTKIQNWIRLLSDDVNKTRKTSLEVHLVDSPKFLVGPSTLGRKTSLAYTLSKKSKIWKGTLRLKKRYSRKQSTEQEVEGDQSIYLFQPLKQDAHGSKVSLNTMSSEGGSDPYDYSGRSWEYRKHLEMLRHVEKHYVWMLKIYQKLYMTWIPSRHREDLAEFIRLLDQILTYHKVIAPQLFEHGMMVNKVCEVIHKCLDDDLFSIYIKYAVHQPTSTTLLKEFYSNPVNIRLDILDPTDQASLLPVDEFTLLPIQQITKLNKCLVGIVQAVMKDVDEEREVDEEMIKWLANLQVIVAKYEKEVQLHYRLNCVRSISICPKDFGLIRYSDLVIMEGTERPNHRIFLMDNGILAARINFEKDGSEAYTSFVWFLSYENIHYKVSLRVNTRLKMWSKSSNNQKYRVTFKDLEKQDEFIQVLEATIRS